MRVRKGDTVMVISGKDKGKKGVVIAAFPAEMKVIVAGANVATIHRKPSRDLPEGGKVKREMPLHISKVAHVDPKLDAPTKVGYKFLADGRKVRFSRRSGELID
ncbi:MAG: 50S ribosomal protein L24 [Proteobacteria bacterium]|nr:50S ribosomal protein L24 [Pseudomonadota bacterium]